MARNSYGMKKYEAADASRKRANGRAKVYGKKFEASAPSLGKVALTIAGGAGAGFINSVKACLQSPPMILLWTCDLVPALAESFKWPAAEHQLQSLHNQLI